MKVAYVVSRLFDAMMSAGTPCPNMMMQKKNGNLIHIRYQVKVFISKKTQGESQERQ